jgi:hypothetical protein
LEMGVSENSGSTLVGLVCVNVRRDM